MVIGLSADRVLQPLNLFTNIPVTVSAAGRPRRTSN